MTLSATTNKVQYNGDGSTTVFAVTFVFWEDADITVIHTDSSGTETTWVNGTQYILTGGSGATGDVTVETSPTDFTPALLETLTIKSTVALIQDTSLPLGGPFPSTSVEQRFDKNVRMNQQSIEELDRSVKLNESSTASEPFIADPVTGEFLRWKSDGTIESADIADSTTATSVDETDTDTTKDKLTSNALAKRAEDTALAVNGVQAASAVNQLQVTNSALSSPILIESTGTDTNIDINITPKGSGTVVIDADLDVDNLNLDGNALISTDTNGDITITPDGTGDLVLDGVNWPQADGSGRSVLATTGTGQAAWVFLDSLYVVNSIADFSSGSPTALTIIDGLTAGVSIVEFYVEGFSTNSANTQAIIQIGDSGGLETSGYSGRGWINLSTHAVSANSTGFYVGEDSNQDAATVAQFYVRLLHMGSNVWTCETRGSVSTWIIGGEGSKTLTGQLDRVSITTTAGTATFDGGFSFARAI